MAGVNLKLVEERVEERDHQVHQRHHKRNQERFGLLEQSPARIVCCALWGEDSNVCSDLLCFSD